MKGMALSQENAEPTEATAARRYWPGFSRSSNRHAFLVNWALGRAHVTPFGTSASLLDFIWSANC
jgi:hypothetical protein